MTNTQAGAQKVLIVNGSMESLQLLETVLDAGHYDVVFVESSTHAYSQIKKVRPDLVILCVRMDDGDGLQVLSMLKLDPDTRAIPILTFATEGVAAESDAATESTEDEDEDTDDDTDEILVLKPVASLMN